MPSNHPLVSIYIISYNSEKTIVSALDSVLNQTYDNLELIVCDDCSKDKTFQITQKWINKYGEKRFYRTVLLRNDENMGCSVSRNRAERECQGDYIKILDSDDILFPNCIESFIQYMRETPNALVVFSRVSYFGDKALVLKCDDWTGGNTHFFNLSIEDQLHFLLFRGNPISNQGVFFNREKFIEYNLFCDERIPMIDDYARWIKALRLGIKLYFYDKTLVKCRVGLGVSTGKPSQSLACYKSGRLFRFYYQYSEWEKSDFEDAVQSIVREECEIYEELIRVRKSKAYRLGKFLLSPLKFIRDLWQ